MIPLMWLFAALFFAHSIAVSPAVGELSKKTIKLRNVFDPNVIIELKETDGLMLVDFWQSRGCESIDTRFDAFVTDKVRPFVDLARSIANVTVFHALSDSRSSLDFGADPRLKKRYWLEETYKRRTSHGKIRIVSKALQQVRAVREYLQKKTKQASRKPPLRVIFSPQSSNNKNPAPCDGLARPRDFRLHSNMSLDLETDFMMEDMEPFTRIAKKGLTRLFYAGGALNQCVLSTRMFSVVEAVFSRRFKAVGIILDLTTLAGTGETLYCGGTSGEAQCIYDFAAWVNQFVHLRPKLSFWEIVQ